LHSIVHAARAFEEIDDYRALLAHAEPPTPATGRVQVAEGEAGEVSGRGARLELKQ
jgi:hypothetical protein